MKFAIVGAGAIGAFVGALLARAGEEVTLIARGAHLRAIRQRGVRVTGALGEFEVRVSATDDPAEVGPVDVVLLTLKAHSLTEMAPRIAPLLDAETTVVSAQNGLPWWYFFRHGGEWEGTPLESVDPGGVIAAQLDAARVIGCVIYCSTIITEPGVIEFIEGTRFPIGELDGAKSERCRRISEAFTRAGLKCPVRSNIRHDIWVKLMGNLVFNPVSALTRATIIEIAQFPETREVAVQMMAEIEAITRKLEIDLGISTEQRLSGAEKVGYHKTSMLQDVEAGRPMELESVVGAVVELGDKLGVRMPYTKTVCACAKLLDRMLQGGKA
jgi:2-dehydropantoate 2-reductase